MKPLVLTVCYLVLLVLLGGCETKQARYNTVQEARNAGLFSRGWAPDVLPEGTGPIVEAYDLDTNARCFRAGFSPDSFSAVRSALSRVGFASNGEPIAQLPPQEFCPFSRSDAEGGRLLHHRTGERQFEYMALRDDGMLYYWSAGDASR